ncbi:hypothetical protein [Phyllobacterium sp. SB3]|uniref:hypothetical protein n=1 Tax=Phyllobacterium sp. SB3 TaxID=3156073 RepID=UPI0032AFA9C6
MMSETPSRPEYPSHIGTPEKIMDGTVLALQGAMELAGTVEGTGTKERFSMPFLCLIQSPQQIVESFIRIDEPLRRTHSFFELRFQHLAAQVFYTLMIFCRHH